MKYLFIQLDKNRVYIRCFIQKYYNYNNYLDFVDRLINHSKTAEVQYYIYVIKGELSYLTQTIEKGEVDTYAY